MTRAALFAGFVASVLAANLALNHWGIVPVPLPYFELSAPAGFYFAGLAFGLRDALHERGGRGLVLAAILVGAVLAYVVEGGATIPGGRAPIAVASAVAFLLSELADLAVYEPLRRRQWAAAVAASNLVGAVVDSALFLWLAFGAVEREFLTGQVAGKVLMVAPALALVWWARRDRADEGLGTGPLLAVEAP